MEAGRLIDHLRYMKYVNKWWRVPLTTRYHFSFGGKSLIDLGVDYTKWLFLLLWTFLLAPEPIINGEDGLILQILEELRVCAANLHKLVEWCLPKAHLRQVNLQLGQKQRGLAQPGYYLHVSEFGGNLKVDKSSFVEIADLFWVTGRI